MFPVEAGGVSVRDMWDRLTRAQASQPHGRAPPAVKQGRTLEG